MGKKYNATTSLGVFQFVIYLHKHSLTYVEINTQCGGGETECCDPSNDINPFF